jgi:hypothetical protein
MGAFTCVTNLTALCLVHSWLVLPANGQRKNSKSIKERRENDRFGCMGMIMSRFVFLSYVLLPFQADSQGMMKHYYHYLFTTLVSTNCFQIQLFCCYVDPILPLPVLVINLRTLRPKELRWSLLDMYKLQKHGAYIMRFRPFSLEAPLPHSLVTSASGGFVKSPVWEDLLRARYARIGSLR